MLKIFFNKKAFSLIGILVAFCISAVSFIAITHAIEVENKNIERKEIAINRNKIISNTKKIQNILSQSYLNRHDKISSGVNVNKTGFSVKTTFFSRNYINTDLYSLRYNSQNKTIEERLGTKGDFTVLLSDITDCSFLYKDKQGNETMDMSKIASITMTIKYAGNPNNKNNEESFTIKQFLNQNS